MVTTSEPTSIPATETTVRTATAQQPTLTAVGASDQQDVELPTPGPNQQRQGSQSRRIMWAEPLEAARRIPVREQDEVVAATGDKTPMTGQLVTHGHPTAR